MSGFPPPTTPPPGGAAGLPAEWPQRALAWLIDMAPAFVVGILGGCLSGVFSAINEGLGMIVMLLIYVAMFGWVIFNYGVKQGTTGYTLGKAIVGLQLVDGATRQPVGTGMAIARYFVHILDSLPCYIGWLWPLWDAKKETFADKILKHAVVVAPKTDPKALILGK
ncbi:MAG: RDD family protein [Aeromicrobium sp.]|uniref:RDD family protein n=1 Tax=Aeromicrobium sp. TaxID=1871063 RepID=UPI0039E4864D